MIDSNTAKMRDLNEDFAFYECRIKVLEDKLSEAQEMIDAHLESRDDAIARCAELISEKSALEAKPQSRLDDGAVRLREYEQMITSLQTNLATVHEQRDAALGRLDAARELLGEIVKDIEAGDDSELDMEVWLREAKDLLSAIIVERHYPQPNDYRSQLG